MGFPKMAEHKDAGIPLQEPTPEGPIAETETQESPAQLVQIIQVNEPRVKDSCCAAWTPILFIVALYLTLVGLASLLGFGFCWGGPIGAGIMSVFKDYVLLLLVIPALMPLHKARNRHGLERLTQIRNAGFVYVVACMISTVYFCFIVDVPFRVKAIMDALPLQEVEVVTGQNSDGSAIIEVQYQPLIQMNPSLYAQVQTQCENKMKGQFIQSSITGWFGPLWLLLVAYQKCCCCQKIKF